MNEIRSQTLKEFHANGGWDFLAQAEDQDKGEGGGGEGGGGEDSEGDSDAFEPEGSSSKFFLFSLHFFV